MNEPTDAQLLEFTARFVGWTSLQDEDTAIKSRWDSSDAQTCCHQLCGRRPEGVHDRDVVPDYLHDLNAWNRDVVPALEKLMKKAREAWYMHLLGLCTDTSWYTANADARSRVLALYRALDGRLPEQEKENAE